MSDQSHRIALFSTSFLPYSQTFIHEELKAHERYDVDVFCKERLNEERFPYDSYYKPNGKVSEFIYENTAYWPSFNRRIGNTNYDLIHAHFGTGAVYALPYKLRHDIPFVVTFHGHDVAALMGTGKYKPKYWRYILYSKKILQKADLILAVSNEMAEILGEISGRPEAVEVFHIGVNLDTFDPVDYEERPKNDQCQITMIGRFTEKKGHIYALKAFKKAVNKTNGAHLNFVGEGGLIEKCRAYVAEHNLKSKVSFHGILESSEISDMLKKSDFLIAPSIVGKDHDREGGPVVIKEANATAIPAIGTYHGGIPEIIDDGKTGFLVPERNTEALADRMIDLIEHPQKRKEFGLAAREKIKRDYNIKTQVQKLESLYDRVADNK
ncbi:glycosyltransferase family 4 protein [Fodinibius halophilus]|uniref:Glycosyltransferase family 4 protein n=1 Tax=Fodinibius halophilus TaxID=1736908 RepID=A0A6M1T100_9BACT|nr:glycosyltransferase family 4 protein [Fodinibius halophilus]NGP86875.1 glycosyltransferase family 4 protein [Fodinibius halophilus]